VARKVCWLAIKEELIELNRGTFQVSSKSWIDRSTAWKISDHFFHSHKPIVKPPPTHSHSPLGSEPTPSRKNGPFNVTLTDSHYSTFSIIKQNQTNPPFICYGNRKKYILALIFFIFPRKMSQ